MFRGGMGRFEVTHFDELTFIRWLFQFNFWMWNNPFHFPMRTVKRAFSMTELKKEGFFILLSRCNSFFRRALFKRQRTTTNCYSTRSFNNACSVSGRTNMSHIMCARPIAHRITMMNYVCVCAEKMKNDALWREKLIKFSHSTHQNRTHNIYMA